MKCNAVSLHNIDLARCRASSWCPPASPGRGRSLHRPSPPGGNIKYQISMSLSSLGRAWLILHLSFMNLYLIFSTQVLLTNSISKKSFQFVKVIWSLFLNECQCPLVWCVLVEGDWECEHGQERAHWERHRATLRAEYQCTVTEDRHGEMERVASHLITQYPSQHRGSYR